MQFFTLRIWRGEPGRQYWEEFSLELKARMNVISALLEIQKNPVTALGVKTTPVAWESGCLEEVCGSCSMLVNGKPRQACTAIIEAIINETHSSVITVAPLSKFPLVKDLVVDRSRMFEDLKRISAWVEVDSRTNEEFGPSISQEQQDVMYQLARCMTCGCCLEACPQVNERSEFAGAASIGQVRFFNIHPEAGLQKTERLREMMKESGVSGCGNAQNCVRVCPKEIPLTDAIAAISRDTTLEAIKKLFGAEK